jgi:hypothetical protein
MFTCLDLKMHQNQNSPQEQDQVYQFAQQLVPFAHYSPTEATQKQKSQITIDQQHIKKVN